jgi:ribose transport system substrate-binding protein
MRIPAWTCALLLTALLGCDKGDSGTGAGGATASTNPSGAGGATGSGRLIGVSFQTMNNPFFVDLDKGLRSVVEPKGDQVVTLDAQYDSNRQRSGISDLINRGAAVIFINPVNWEGVKGSLLQAKRANIPCIIVDAPVEDQSLVISTVASDNVEAGRLACRALAAARPEAKLVILHLSVNKACIDRVAGFKEEMAKHPGMKLLDTQEGKGTTEASLPVTRDLLGRYPELDAIFAINDPSALGAISALESAGKLKDVAVVSVDGSERAITAIKQGRLLSTSAQFPVEMGKAAAEQAYNHLEGRPVEKDVKVRVELIDNDNAERFGKDAAPAAAAAK